jgi:hypothetical protein
LPTKILFKFYRRKRPWFFEIEIVGSEGLSKSSLKIGQSIMMAMAVFAFVVFILWISITEIMFVSDYLAYTGTSLSNALAAGSKSAELWLTTKRLWGVGLLGISVS